MTTSHQAGELPVERRLFSPGRKRVLTLDGGGVRGIVSIAFLAEMERQLREATGRKDLVLADVFDLIIGTSVGSMLATMLALGRPVAEVEAAFRDLAPRIFSGRETMFGMRRFDARPLVNGVHAIVKDETLGSPNVVTGLGIVAKRVDTDSVWVLTNNPRMRYFNDGPDWDGNRHYPLYMLIRASTAAPFLFTPAEITIHTDRFGKKVTGYFVDGGVTPHNNPALQALLMAAMPAYHLNWPLSPESLLMISVGTGIHRTPVDRSRRVLAGSITKAALRRFLGREGSEDIEEAAYAAQTLRSLVSDSALFALKMLQSVSHPRFSWRINGEVGSLEGQLLLDALAVAAPEQSPQALMRFQRYDLPLETGGLVPAQFDVSATQEQRLALHSIDRPELIAPLHALAQEAAARQVSMLDFADFVDGVRVTA